MPRSKATAPAAPSLPTFDHRGPGIVLEYLGGATPRYVPARDLEGPDLARVAYRRAADVARRSRSGLIPKGEERPAPRRADPASLEDAQAIAEELVAGGRFGWAANAPETVTTPPADDPAPEPVGEAEAPVPASPVPVDGDDREAPAPPASDPPDPPAEPEA